MSKTFSITGCPKCDEPTTGLCNKHKLEYLKYCADTARDEYYSALEEQLTKIQERIQSEHNPDKTVTDS